MLMRLAKYGVTVGQTDSKNRHKIYRVAALPTFICMDIKYVDILTWGKFVVNLGR